MTFTNSKRFDVVKRQIEDGIDAFRDSKDKAHEAKFAPHAKFTNWAHIGSCHPKAHYRPKDEAEVVTILKAINREKGAKARTAGAGASPNAICFTNDSMIHVKEHMNNVISVDKVNKTITCQGGCTLKRIYATLDAADMMIPCVPSFIETTIAGCIGTGTHSSGINVKSLHSYVVALRVVTATGEVKTVSKANNLEEWKHWTCHLGVLGIITEVTLQAERKTLWRRISAPISLSNIPSVLEQRIADNEYYRFWWTPHTTMCYEATIRPVAAADDEQEATSSAKGDLEAPGRHVSGDPHLTIGDANLDKYSVAAIAKALHDPHSSHQLWNKHRSEQQLIADVANRVLPEPVNVVAVQHTVLERALHAATFTPALQPAINQAYQKTYLDSTQEQYGNVVEVMSFDCLFRQHTAEWAIDVKDTLEALNAVRRIIDNNNLKVHFPVEFRFTDSDESTMSPCKGRKTCFVGIVMFKPLGREAPDTQRFLQLFSKEMQRLGGRSHWAKYYHFTSRDVATMFGANDWQAFNAYREQCDPNGIFVNDWYSAMLQ